MSARSRSVTLCVCVLIAGALAAGQQTTAPAEETPKVAPRQVPLRIHTAWPFDAKEAARRQKEAAQALGLPAEKAVDLGGGVKIELVLIPPGEFLMGSATSSDETHRRSGRAGYPGLPAFKRSHPRHRVRITKPFYMGKYEVTQDVWEKAMGTKWERPANDNRGKVLKPVDYKGARRPVDRASLGTSPGRDCLVFLKKLNALVKGEQPFRLPTDAQWEYACRAGTATPFYFGETISTDQANVRGTWSAWDGKKGVDRRKTVQVGSLPPNAWGLHEMHGNVWEWCEDVYEDFPKDAKTRTDPSGPAKRDRRAERVLRGGAFGHTMAESRSAFRRPVGGGYQPNDADVGFRLVLTLPPKTDPPPKK